MNTNFILLERIVYESLWRGAKNIEELQQDTGISEKVLLRILNYFCQRQWASAELQTYHLTAVGKAISGSLSLPDRKLEALEFFSTLFDHSLNQQGGELKMKKVWMDECERLLFRSLIDRVEEFVATIQKRNRQANRRRLAAESLQDQMVVLWGSTRYGDLVSSALNPIGGV